MAKCYSNTEKKLYTINELINTGYTHKITKKLLLSYAQIQNQQMRTETVRRKPVKHLNINTLISINYHIQQGNNNSEIKVC